MKLLNATDGFESERLLSTTISSTGLQVEPNIVLKQASIMARKCTPKAWQSVQ